jgi:hypothetical protein
VSGAGRHIAHFNWATLVADLDSPRIAPFERSIDKVNAVAARSPGYVWNSGREMAEGVRIGWPLFTGNPRLIASFSVWESSDHFRDYVYKTVHAAFYRRGHEWFEPDAPRGYVLWRVPAGHVPRIEEARDRVESYRALGSGPEVFDLAWLDAQPA